MACTAGCSCRSTGWARKAAQSAGLGLTLARGLTEAMDGQLTADSRPGAGTTSSVVLPAG